MDYIQSYFQGFFLFLPFPLFPNLFFCHVLKHKVVCYANSAVPVNPSENTWQTSRGLRDYIPSLSHEMKHRKEQGSHLKWWLCGVLTWKNFLMRTIDKFCLIEKQKQQQQSK